MKVEKLQSQWDFRKLWKKQFLKKSWKIKLKYKECAINQLKSRPPNDHKSFLSNYYHISLSSLSPSFSMLCFSLHLYPFYILFPSKSSVLWKESQKTERKIENPTNYIFSRLNNSITPIIHIIISSPLSPLLEISTLLFSRKMKFSR